MSISRQNLLAAFREAADFLFETGVTVGACVAIAGVGAKLIYDKEYLTGAFGLFVAAAMTDVVVRTDDRIQGLVRGWRERTPSTSLRSRLRKLLPALVLIPATLMAVS